jgi:hypothetical protein
MRSSILSRVRSHRVISGLNRQSHLAHFHDVLSGAWRQSFETTGAKDNYVFVDDVLRHEPNQLINQPSTRHAISVVGRRGES